MGYNIAVIGASGMVGRKILQVLAEENIEIENLYLFSSSRSAGGEIIFKNISYNLIELKEENFKNIKIDYALFCAGGSISKEFVPKFAKLGVIVIDNSSAFRMNSDVPLIVPEVNAHAITNHKNIISNPNCSTIQAVVALAPLHKVYGIKRIVFSTYQAVSGAGKSGVDDLKNGELGKNPKKFSAPIYNNVIPHIDEFLPNGYTKEEQKMIDETRKILDDNNIKITATTVRVPVENCHSESINVQFKKPFLLDEVKDILFEAKGVKLFDDPAYNVYPMPFIADNKNEVFIGRLRVDDSVENGLNMWVVADNLRKGAATNAVQILQTLINR
mgnify:CR=1 FL=1